MVIAKVDVLESKRRKATALADRVARLPPMAFIRWLADEINLALGSKADTRAKAVAAHLLECAKGNEASMDQEELHDLLVSASNIENPNRAEIAAIRAAIMVEFALCEDAENAARAQAGAVAALVEANHGDVSGMLERAVALSPS